MKRFTLLSDKLSKKPRNCFSCLNKKLRPAITAALSFSLLNVSFVSSAVAETREIERVRFCNHSQKTVEVAIGYWGAQFPGKMAGPEYTTEGWWTLAARDCVMIEPERGFRLNFDVSGKNGFFYYAKATDGSRVWSGGNDFCVTNRAFTLPHIGPGNSAQPCTNSGDRMIGFTYQWFHPFDDDGFEFWCCR